MKLKIKALSPKIGKEIPFPFYATPGSAAMDLHACIREAVTIPAGGAVRRHGPRRGRCGTCARSG